MCIRDRFRIGGAQAIGALAFGTNQINKVDVISGPGNIYVTTAKKLIYGSTGIDSLAGPSEILIIADETAQSTHIASDLLAQAEHDPSFINTFNYIKEPGKRSFGRTL